MTDATPTQTPTTSTQEETTSTQDETTSTQEETTSTQDQTTVTPSEPTPTEEPASPTTSTTTAAEPTATSYGIQGDLSLFVNPTEQFQDGVHSCDSVPAGQGVISLDHLGFGGFSGIENADGSTGGLCREGSYCSYACQPGMSKTQWPESQPSNGVSIGGLLCRNGKLYKSSNSDYLCEWGPQSAVVVSEIDDSVSICRTDYPGTENMVIPTVVGAGAEAPLSVVDGETYYQWLGMPTSAQFYVNNKGVSYTDGCQWGSPGSGIGNWSPLNFGAGYSQGVSYLSLIPNPNNREGLNFNVRLEAYDENSTVVGSCVYENGYFNGDGTDGCTVAVTKGSAKYVLY